MELGGLDPHFPSHAVLFGDVFAHSFTLHTYRAQPGFGLVGLAMTATLGVPLPGSGVAVGALFGLLYPPGDELGPVLGCPCVLAS